jgi:hypothetical protein
VELEGVFSELSEYFKEGRGYIGPIYIYTYFSNSLMGESSYSQTHDTKILYLVTLFLRVSMVRIPFSLWK